MKKFDLLLFLIVWLVCIALFEVKPSMSSHLLDEDNMGREVKEYAYRIPVSTISITITFDNNPYTPGLKTAWGFSCLIKGAEKTILFDTGGNGSSLLENMNELGIDPQKIDIVVLSHIHGDHVGGLKEFLDKNEQVTVYLPRSFPQEFKGNLLSASIKIMEVHEATKICEGVYTTGELGAGIKEQSLIVHTTQGMIVITGCAHPGIVAILKRARALIKDDILLAMGGFHLGGAGQGEIEKIILSFRSMGVKFVGPCHCSGDLARKMFKEEYGDSYLHLGVGKVIKF